MKGEQKGMADAYVDGTFNNDIPQGVHGLINEVEPHPTINVRDADYVIVMLGTNRGLTLNGDKTNYEAYRSLLSGMCCSKITNSRCKRFQCAGNCFYG